MRAKNITVTVSVRVSVTVRVSLVLSVSTNSFGASNVAICRRCVYKTVLQLIAETAIRSTVLRITSAINTAKFSEQQTSACAEDHPVLRLQ